MLTILVIGSGPIIIGQAAEFDYSGTQAIKALKASGHRVVLLNNNPATIMTDLDMVDVLYSEAMTFDVAQQVIEREKPHAIVLGMGGQTALNIGMQLYTSGLLDAHDIKVLGTHPQDIIRAEDRDLFKTAMQACGEPVIASQAVTSLKEGQEAAITIGYPVIVRPAFTLGGFGGGICFNQDELTNTVNEGIKKSPVGQVLIEKSVYGWKEIEYEMMRDREGNTIAVCNMENMDPVGIHTGDSIVVAPSQTLNDRQYQMLRQASINIVNHLKIIGGCNVQFALCPLTDAYFIIEVNPRVSRSSALATKATGYAIAEVAMKLGLGQTLDKVDNRITGKTKACHEPTLDYCVVKLPRWPYDKLASDQTHLGTVMQATGEVMAIGASFEEALLKAIRSLETKQHDLFDTSQHRLASETLLVKCMNKAYDRLYALAELIRRGISSQVLVDKTHIDAYFINRLTTIIKAENLVKQTHALQDLNDKDLMFLNQLGFTNISIANLGGWPLEEVTSTLDHLGIKPRYRLVDTCGGEFEALSNYAYSTYRGTNESHVSKNQKVIVVGAGPIRIGQGVEFDYSAVKALRGLRRLGYEAIMINNNPETVSTDHDESDKLYFEPITHEDVLAIIRHEQPLGVLLQFGGQTAIKLAKSLEEEGVNLLGVTSHVIDTLEDRDKFYDLLDHLAIKRPKDTLGPFLMDEYIQGTEYDIDAISDGHQVFIPGFMEHIDQSGIHSGDSLAQYPANLTKIQTLKLWECIESLCSRLNYKGIINFQFIKKATTFT